MEGCYFHYIKNLWKYAKSHSLCSKILFDKTKLIIFGFIIYHYLINEEKKYFYKKLNEYYSKLDDKYIAVFKYYNKFWIKNNLLNINQLSKEKYKFRTNNYIERYHLLLSENFQLYIKISREKKIIEFLDIIQLENEDLVLVSKITNKYFECSFFGWKLLRNWKSNFTSL